MSALPTDAKQRKAVPIATGVVDYFPDALAAVAAVSKRGGEQHNPGKPLFWDRTKSTDEADCLMRHFVDRGTIDTDGMRHSAKVAWRALALLQKEIEAAGQAVEDAENCKLDGRNCSHPHPLKKRDLGDVEHEAPAVNTAIDCAAMYSPATSGVCGRCGEPWRMGCGQPARCDHKFTL